MPRAPDSPGDNLSKFDRQRRNLTLSWAVLFFFITVEPKLDRLVLPGGQASVILEAPELLLFWIVGIHIYFLIRYHQFFNAAVLGMIGTDVRARQNLVAEAAVRKKALPKIHEQFPDTRNGALGINITGKGGSEKEWLFQYDHVHHIPKDGAAASLQMEPVHVSIEGFELWWIKQKGLLAASWYSPFFTEYWLPFVLPHVVWIWAALRLL